MSISLNDNLRILAPKSTDSRYGPHANTSVAISAIPLTERHLGLTVGVFDSGNIVEYWFRVGTADGDLELKQSGGSGYTGSAGAGFTGSAGTTGFTGSAGADGSIGFTGSQGTQGTTGTTGFTGSAGVDGSIGFTGSQGAQGTTGTTGFTGSQGEQGTTGTTGFTGSAGAGFTGSAGTTGFTGSAGVDGALGFTGSAGAGFTGSAGALGYTGSAGTGGGATVTTSDTPPGSPVDGDLWWDSTQAQLMIYYDDGNSSQWVAATSTMSGYTGSAGSLGYTGSAGTDGINGFTGSAGAGFTGSAGAIGFTGSAGADGSIGFTGSAGAGFTGSAGTTGFTGSAGVDGAIGFTGSAGAGFTGSAGAIGFTGSAGADGSIGFTGSAGAGFTGSAGTTGFTGSAGADGSIGFTGSAGAGFTGSAGAIGYTGSAGADGSIGFTGSAGAGFTGSAGAIGYTGSAGTGGASNLSVSANVGLDLTSEVLSTTYNTTIADSVNSISIGGAVAAPASYWKTRNLVQIIDAIMFPDIGPTYTIPTITLSGNISNGTVLEIGRPVTQSLTANALTNDAGAFSNLSIRQGSTVLVFADPLTGSVVGNIASQFGYSDPNNPILGYSLSYSHGITVASGTTTWSANSSYAAGLPKLNNKGVTDANVAAVRSTVAPQAMSNSFTSSSISISGIYPYFYGKSSNASITTADIANVIQSGGATKVLSAASGTVTITYAANNEIVWFAHHNSYTEKTVWYRTELDQGPIGAGNFILSPATHSINSPDGYWSTQSFKIYKSGNLDSGANPIQFRNS